MQKKFKIIIGGVTCVVLVAAFFIIRHQLKKHLQARRRSLSIKRQEDFDRSHSSLIAQEEKVLEPILINQEKRKIEDAKRRNSAQTQQNNAQTQQNSAQPQPYANTNTKPTTIKATIVTSTIVPPKKVQENRVEELPPSPKSNRKMINHEESKAQEADKRKTTNKKKQSPKKQHKKKVESSSDSELSQFQEMIGLEKVLTSEEIKKVESQPKPNNLFGLFDMLKQILEEPIQTPVKENANTQFLAESINNAVQDMATILPMMFAMGEGQIDPASSRVEEITEVEEIVNTSKEQVYPDPDSEAFSSPKNDEQESILDEALKELQQKDEEENSENNEGSENNEESEDNDDSDDDWNPEENESSHESSNEDPEEGIQFVRVRRIVDVEELIDNGESSNEDENSSQVCSEDSFAIEDLQKIEQEKSNKTQAEDSQETPTQPENLQESTVEQNDICHIDHIDHIDHKESTEQ